MSDDDKLVAMFATLDEPVADDGFTGRVLALAALDERMAARRHGAALRIGGEAAALAGVLALFAGLSSIGPASDVVPLASPAMIGLLLLGLWLSLGVRGTVRGS